MRYFISTILSFVKKVWPTFKPGIVMTAGLKFTFSPNDNFLLIVIVQNYIPLIVQIKKSFLFFQTALVLSKPDSRGIKCNHGRGDSPVVSWNQKEANLIVIRVNFTEIFCSEIIHCHFCQVNFLFNVFNRF